jgi:hypothetical protein
MTATTRATGGDDDDNDGDGATCDDDKDDNDDEDDDDGDGATKGEDPMEGGMGVVHPQYLEVFTYKNCIYVR